MNSSDTKYMNLIKNYLTIFLAALICFALLTAVGCKSKTADTLQKVSCRLKWHHQAQFAGLYVAQDMGFFREAGLDTVLIQGGPNISVPLLVASGSDDFGIAGADEILIAREKGLPLVALAVVFQKSPVCFFSKKESGIINPYDFIGRRVAMQYGTNVRNEYEAMMLKLGIDMSQVKEVPSGFNMQQFFNGNVDVWNGYIINEPLAAEKHGFKVNIIRPSDYGIDMYSDTLFTTDEMIKKKPDLVRKMVKATIAGWEYALAHPEEAVKAVLKRDPRLKSDHEKKMLEIEASLIVARKTNKYGLGWMDEEVWESMRSTLETLGILKKNSIKIKDVYTNEFLPR